MLETKNKQETLSNKVYRKKKNKQVLRNCTTFVSENRSY